MMKTSVLLDHEPVAGGRIVRLLLRVQATAPPRADRLPLNLSLVLDRSGSMSGAKLAVARAAAALLVRRLAPDDVVSVVAYDDTVITVAEPARGAAQAELPRAIERIECGGSTNLSGGWLRGRELVAQHLTPHAVNRIILLTDGLANVGITDQPTLTGLAAQGTLQGVTTTTIGFGADYDEAVLRAIADAGGGNMYYVEQPDQAPSIFNDELQGLLDLGAQNVSVLIVPAAAAQLVAVHHDYPSIRAEGLMRVQLGDLYAREPKPMLIEFLVRDVARETAVAELTLAADVMLEHGGVERQTIRLPVTVSAAEGARVEPEVQRELLVQEAARARRDALEQNARGDYTGAAQTLATLREKLAAAPPAYAHDLLEEVAELDSAAASLRMGEFSAADAKYMNQRAYNAATGRRQKDALIRRPPHRS